MMLLFRLLLTSVLCFQICQGAIDPNDQIALQNFREWLDNLGNLGWDISLDLCGQTGVTCDSSSPHQRVTSLDLSSKGLTGSLAPDLGSLTKLTTLQLSSNLFAGNIPTELGNLAELKTLKLDSNNFATSIPTELGNLSKLEYLHIQSNQLTGTIPTELGNLHFLFELNLGYNTLSGTLPESLGRLTNLLYLILTTNLINGTIPDIFQNLTGVIYLGLDSNQLSGTIPEFKNAIRLQTISLSYNQLSGTIPNPKNLTVLQTLDLRQNQLTGTIPTQLQSLPSLSKLYLDSNQLSGPIPTFLLSMAHLNDLYLVKNYWDCFPINYSSIQNNDFDSVNSDCEVACGINFCNNGGTCVAKPVADGDGGGGKYLCLCTPNFEGVSCEIAFCPYIIEGNAEWNRTIFDLSETINGRCLDGFEGNVSRTCGGVDHFDWSPLNNICEDIDECSTNNGGCHIDAICTNTPGNFSCECRPGYSGDGYSCSICPVHHFPFNETECLPCPVDSTVMLKWRSIADCNCTSLNYYPDIQTLTCLPCPLGSLLDNESNTCKKIICPTLALEGGIFQSAEVFEKSYSNCYQNYYVFQNTPPYSPLQGQKGEAICSLNNDGVTASWNISKECEPICTVRDGKCDNQQVCAKPTGESFDRCICAGYIGKYCENIDPQGCDTLSCLNDGSCVNKTDTTAAYCNCTGRGFTGRFCETDINDCVANVTCLNGGTCYDVGVGLTVCLCPLGFIGKQCELCTPDTCSNNGKCIIQNGISSCNCFGTGYEGDFCEIQKEDCRVNGCGLGRCITISQNDTAYCNCFGTGYKGDSCELQKDCRSKKCLNNGECRIDYEEDSAKCICEDEYKGDICEMEKYSTVDQLTVYYFLGPIFVIYLLVCLGIFLQARRGDRETKKSWIFFLLRFLMSCLGIFDLLTDIFFIIQSFDYGIEENNFGFFWSSLVFTVVPWSLAAICTGVFLVAWKKKLDLSDSSHNNFVIFSFFTVVSLLSANGVETFHLVSKYLFLKEGKVIQVSDYAGYLTIYFIIKTFIEDFPQLIIQGIFQSQLGKANPVVTLSLANSALSCFITIVTFPFTHEFDYLKVKFNEMISGSGNFYQPSKEQLFQMQ